MASFTDLNPDVLLHIAAFLSPPKPALGVHWLNGAQPIPSHADVRALRATCRHAWAAIPAGDLNVRINDGFNVLGDIVRWANAPAHVLARVKRITLPPSARGLDLVLPAIAQRRFDAFMALLSACPNLSALDIAHNPFCAHDAYGLGTDRSFAVSPPILLHLKVKELSIALKCRICAIELPHTLALQCQLTALRTSVVVLVPGPRALSSFVRDLGSLRTLHLKVGDHWGISGILRALAPCTALQELHIAPYDASRKVCVVERFADPGVPSIAQLLGGPMDPPTSAQHDAAVAAFLPALGAFNLVELDLCMSTAVLDRTTVDMDHCPEWVEKAERAARALVGACPTLKRGWWWIQVVDLDYGQLQGYERWGWAVDGDGLVVLDAEPRRLAPMVVWNQDGQGTTDDIWSELWN